MKTVRAGALSVKRDPRWMPGYVEVRHPDRRYVLLTPFMARRMAAALNMAAAEAETHRKVSDAN